MSTDLVLLSRVSYRDQEITRPRLRSLLALLSEDLRTGCSAGRLVEALWPDTQPENPGKALQVLVSHARAQLGSEIIASTAVGYRLTLSEDQVDASALLLSTAASARHSRAGDHAAALADAEAGLALWDGIADVEPNDPLSALRAARATAYRSLVRTRALALSRLGRRAEALEPLTVLSQEHPRDEEILAELLRCEAATAGPAAALARYDAYRHALRDELGSDPGPVLQGVYQRLLQTEKPVVRYGVPHEPNPLLGRDADIAAVTDLLHSSRVTSIIGPGGLGKTRLAHVVSREAEQRVVYLVALVGVSTDADVASEVASALGVGETARARLVIPTDVLTGIVNVLGPGPTLLVLDNCEHVVRGVAELVQALVSMTKDLRVLTTSRAPLGLSSESVYLLPELSLATTVELFQQRARAARPGVELPADVVAELCARLDGLPLAVELAAARVRVMSVAEVARRLDDRFALLRGTTRDAPQRHQTLHAVIDWSWNLLEPEAQAAMRALSVFAGGFTADAARHVIGDADVLEQLVDQSLLKVTDTGSGTRFRMLETVREFSTAHRDEAGETARVVSRFLAWARDFGTAHHDSVFGSDVTVGAERIRVEQDNLVLAWRLGLDLGDGATVAATSAALGSLWTVESNFNRLATLAGETTWLLSHFRPSPGLVEATRTASVLTAVSGILMRGGGVARSLVTVGKLPPASPDTLPRALAVVLRARDLTALRDSDNPLLAGVANYVDSYAKEDQNDLDGALLAAQRTLAAFEKIADLWWIKAGALSRISELHLQAGDGEEARRYLFAVASIVDKLGPWAGEAKVRWALVLASLQCGAIDDAEYWLRLAMQSGGEEAADSPMFDTAVRAEILLARGDVETGLALWRRTAARLHDSDHPAWAGEVHAIVVVAHAQHGRLDLVGDVVAAVPGRLARLLANPVFGDMPHCGALLLALAMTDLAAGAVQSGVRLVALAERFRFARGFQPTMSPERATQAAREADSAAYADAVAWCAGIEDLRATALTLVQTRINGPGHA